MGAIKKSQIAELNALLDRWQGTDFSQVDSSLKTIHSDLLPSLNELAQTYIDAFGLPVEESANLGETQSKEIIVSRTLFQIAELIEALENKRIMKSKNAKNLKETFVNLFCGSNQSLYKNWNFLCQRKCSFLRHSLRVNFRERKLKC